MSPAKEAGGDALDNPLQAVICFRNEGKPWNPLEHKDPDIGLPANECEPGGLVFFAKNLVFTL